MGHAETAAALAEALTGGDIILAAESEVEARAIARALTLAAPQAQVVLVPESDALAGRDAPASPANLGARNAALARLRALARAGDRGPVLGLVDLETDVGDDRRLGLVGDVDDARGADAFAMGGEAKRIRDFTVCVEQFVESIIGSCGEKDFKTRINYA